MNSNEQRLWEKRIEKEQQARYNFERAYLLNLQAVSASKASRDSDSESSRSRSPNLNGY